MEEGRTVKMISLSRAGVASEDVLCVVAVLDSAEIYQPDARAYQYRHRADLGEYWYYENFPLSVQDVVYLMTTIHLSPISFYCQQKAMFIISHRPIDSRSGLSVQAQRRTIPNSTARC